MAQSQNGIVKIPVTAVLAGAIGNFCTRYECVVEYNMYFYIDIKYMPNRLVCFHYSIGEGVREPPTWPACVRVCVVRARCLSQRGCTWVCVNTPVCLDMFGASKAHLALKAERRKKNSIKYIFTPPHVIRSPPGKRMGRAGRRLDGGLHHPNPLGIANLPT